MQDKAGTRDREMGGGAADALSQSMRGGFNPLSAISALSGLFSRGQPQQMAMPQQMMGLPAMGGGLLNARLAALRGIMGQQQQQPYAQSPGMGFLLANLAARGWQPTPQPIQGYGNLMGTGGFNSFMGAMSNRFGQPSAAYQGYLQSLQERRDARAGVPAIPPQGAGSASAQRRIPATMAGSRSY